MSSQSGQVHFSLAQARAKLGRRVRAVKAKREYGINRDTTGMVTRVLSYRDGTAEVLITWDLPPVMILRRRQQLRDVFNRHDYERMLEEIVPAAAGVDPQKAA